MELLFEYGKQVDIKNRVDLENYLCLIWKDYKELWPDINTFDSSRRLYQPFLSFDGSKAKANNFIGFINHNDNLIEIYPKVFQFMAVVNKGLMHQHLFYWFSYCRKIKFPFNQSFLDSFDIEELPDLIIYLIARQIYETMNSQPYSTYEEHEEALATPRGRISFSRYATSLSYGRHHIIDCDYEPFTFDNTLNRTIKYCVRILQNQSKHIDTQRILNEITFLLEDVEDQSCTVNQLNKIKIPRLFEAYEEVLESCKMILENKVYSHAEHEMKNWSLLFPMEYVFEHFISGFLQRHFSKDYLIETQKSELYLQHEPNAFKLQHDILITNRHTKEKIIVDTKYKPRWGLNKDDRKQGVSQSDMYQMISYAYRRGSDKVILMYPNTNNDLAEDYVFRVKKADGSEVIQVKVIDVPFWSSDDFKSVEVDLLKKIEMVLKTSFN